MNNFLMIDKQLFDDLYSGDLTGEEWVVLLHLFDKANITNGKAGANYRSIVAELEDFFKVYKDPVNQVNKVMLSLRKKRKIWFKKHPGSKNKFTVWIDKYPCKKGAQVVATDILNKFLKNNEKNEYNPAEVSNSQQRSEELKNSKSKLLSQVSMDSASRGPHRKIYKYRKR